VARACVIFNPVARGDRARRFRAQLESLKAGFELLPTNHAGHATELAKDALRQGYDRLVAAGGDGTVNEVINGIVAVDPGMERSSLAVIPLGTANVFARELGLPLGLRRALNSLISDHLTECRVDLPFAEYQLDGKAQRRWFVQLAGAGLDSRAIERVRWQLKKRIGPLAYVWAGVEAMRSGQPTVKATTSTDSADGELVLVGNGRFYGGPFPAFPRARMNDGRLDVRVFRRANWLALCRFAVWLISRRDRPPAGESWLQSEKVTLTSAESVPFEADGDNVGPLPVTFGVSPLALRVLKPA